jgi:hypothetical protein
MLKQKKTIDYECFAAFGLAKTPVAIHYPANVEQQLGASHVWKLWKFIAY